MTGKHWSAEKVANIFAPSRHSTNKVEAWLVESGVNKDRITYSTGMFTAF